MVLVEPERSLILISSIQQQTVWVFRTARLDCCRKSGEAETARKIDFIYIYNLKNKTKNPAATAEHIEKQT